jgi:hypothetical protein
VLEDSENQTIFSEFAVSISTLERFSEPVILIVWAKDIEDAIDCGEVLSAIYLSD